jgi:hypothetical protein
MNLDKNVKPRGKQLQMRNKLWPSVKDSELWLRQNSNGFITIPRTMPLVMNIMDEITKGKPVSSTYFELFCRSFDECFVVLNKPTEMAFHAGFTGQRAERTWRDRMEKLKKLGYIDIKPGPSGALSYALIYNPYLVTKLLHETGLVTEEKFNALIMRAVEIGAEDLD